MKKGWNIFQFDRKTLRRSIVSHLRRKSFKISDPGDFDDLWIANALGEAAEK